ncbi:MAG: hypothetical protein ACHQX3_00990 [Nitrospirales bacterium]|jgi:hypothetical protein
MATPVTNRIHEQFQRTMTASVNASDFRWEPGFWPTHFYIMGRENCFNYYSDIYRDRRLQAKVYRDSMGFEIIVDNK